MKFIRTHDRISIRLKKYDYSQPGEYFITICTYNRECIFGEVIKEEMQLSQFGEIAKQCWMEIPKYYTNVELDEYVIMSNHIHGIIVITESVGAIHESPLQMTQYQRRTMKLSKIVGRFKSTTAKQINILRHSPGIPIWQRGYYDHIIRNEKELNNIRDYILNNPLKWFYDEENPNRQKTGTG